MSWEEVEIRDFGRVVTGKTPPTKEKKYFNGNYCFISPKDLGHDSRYILDSQTKISKLAIDKFKNQVLPKNSIFFTALSFGFGKIGIANELCLTNQQINSIIVDSNEYDFNFIYYLLRNYTPLIRSYDAGIVTPIVPKSVFEKIKLNVPKHKITQSKIGNILSAYDDLIQNNLKRINLLEQAAQNIYKEWFVNMRFPGHENTPINEDTRLPEGWEKDFLGNQLASVKRKKKLKKDDYLSNGTYPIIDQSDGYIGGYSEDIKAVQDSPLPIVIFGDHTRRVKYINFPFISGADGTQLLYPKNINLLPAYFYLAVQSIDLSDYAYARHFKYLKQQEIIIPCNSVVLKFNNRVYPLLNQSIHLLSYNVKLKAARDILLPRLMNRTIEV